MTLYGREGCHLCEQARAELIGLRERMGGRGFDLVEVDIETDEDLHRRYLERIPVVALDGVELYDFFVDADDLASRVSSDS